ncbi:MAG: acyl-CoA dehydratase activase-related protein [Puniceicoccales bacterium]|jgi:activator of 2-hydroxyglutaryl-CoA dehydratase/predicted nucleotide-binding protein (sugar kinase/HSP70/actin superfamily)|nr:acyl-CoA dehydratase activase-related protein [Puniceicoccales bacterium]
MSIVENTDFGASTSASPRLAGFVPPPAAVPHPETAAHVVCPAGLDAGSTTLKLVILDPATRKPLVGDYCRHRADIPGTLASMLAAAAERLSGIFPGGPPMLSLVVTGSAGMGLAEAAGLPFIQESIAAAAMARHYHPGARTLVDIGGEDAKMIFFTPGHAPDIRMNGSCAGGTGAFLDQIATLLDCDPSNLDVLARAAVNLHPVASRCGVFAKTDIQNLLARNIPQTDIAASAFHAVAQQIVSTLARGRDIMAPVLYCGGPLAHLSRLRAACATAFGIAESDCLLPENAALVPALGCAIAGDSPRVTVPLSSLRQWAEARSHRARPVAPGSPGAPAASQTPCTGCVANFVDAAEAAASAAGPSASAPLAPLFEDAAHYARWRASRERVLPASTFADNPGTAVEGCWLGVDSGSTTTKIVALDPAGALLFTHYAPNNGNPLEALRAGLARFHAAASAAGFPSLPVRRAAVTGYGEDLLKAAFGFESGIVETMAHLSAARSIDPRVSFLLDIGGQDMKAVFVENDAIVRLDINEACSSGCGSFMDTFARSLGHSAAEFASLACQSARPCDLGTRCTVFMNSKVKQAQRENATRADIAAGLAYSIAKNCLYKVLKLKSTAELGTRVVVQGGTMRNHAVVRALERLTGLEIAIAPLPELMGAYGAALHARAEGESLPAGAASPPRLLAGLANPQPHTVADAPCGGCENRCHIRSHTFANGNVFHAGNKCERVYSNGGARRTKGRNLHADKHRLLWGRPASGKTAAPEALKIGIPRALGFFENYPFWHALLTRAGLRVTLSAPSTFKLYGQGVRSIMSDNICFPAKLVHGHIHDLAARKVDRILMPFIVHEAGPHPDVTASGGIRHGSGKKIPASHAYNCPIVTGYSDVIRSALAPASKYGIPLDAPTLTFADPRLLREACRAHMVGTLGVDARVFEEAYSAAHMAQAEYARALAALAREILDANLAQAAATPAGQPPRPLILLAGRPYHNDPLIQHKIAEMFSDLGADVLTEDLARALPAIPNPAARDSSWAYPNRILACADWVAGAPEHVHFVQITSFGCGPDAFIMDEVGDRLRRAHKSHTVLKVDDINNPGSLRLRARSLLESLAARRKLESPFRQCGTRAAASGTSAGVSGVKTSPALPRQAAGARRSEAIPRTPPFTEADRATRTVLVPFFAEFYSPYIPILLRKMGYKAEALPPPDASSINYGLQFSNNEICYPATLVIGDFIRALKSGKYDRSRVAFGITQTGGQCRASSYLLLIKKALLAAGYDDVPVVSLGTNVGAASNEQPGFSPKWNLRTISGLCQGMFYSDYLSQMYHSAAPRERVPGDAARLRDTYIAAGGKVLESARPGDFLPLLRQAADAFNGILRPGSENIPRVGIVGEIYIKYSAIGNLDLVQWLVRQGVEPVMPPLCDFFLQEIPNRFFNRHNHLSRGDWTVLAEKLIHQLIRRWQRRYAAAASAYRHHHPNEDIYEKWHKAAPIVNRAAQYGEGWLIPAELACFAESGILNAVSLQPFGCIANHLIAKGVERNIRARYPRMNLLFLDLDSGTSEANLLNRLHFIVQNARDEAKPRQG